MDFSRLTDGSELKERTLESRENFESRNRGESEEPVPLGLAPLTGRDTELSLLKDRWEQAQEGMGQVVLVIGESGLGKSRLVQTLAQFVRTQASSAALAEAGKSASASVDQDFSLIEWRGSGLFKNSELYPVSECLERLLGIQCDGSPAAEFDRWRGIWMITIWGDRRSLRSSPSCFCCRQTSGIRWAASRLLASVRRPFGRCVNGCWRALGNVRSSSWSRICTGLTRRAWSFSNGLSAMARTTAF
jgi:energy-coupling factor transporter ATP-binding protein EcfA2